MKRCVASEISNYVHTIDTQGSYSVLNCWKSLEIWHGKCWKTEVKSWKNGKSLLFFFESYNTCSTSEIFLVFVKSYSISPAGHGKSFFSAFFKVSVDHLFDKLMFFVKKSGSSLEFWIKICTSPVCRIPTRKGIWYSMDTSPISDSPFKGLGAAPRGAAQLRFVTEIVPKSPFLCVNRSPVWYGFRAGAKATWYSENAA